eukprot:3533749-Alexandrium_andersonii.AAC.1
MSASLVGSEMCIRDSLLLGLGGCLWRRLRPRPRKWVELLRLVHAEGILAVSYTHLTLPTICSV